MPNIDETKFDILYENWLKVSQRENTMDEYGQLIFLRDLSDRWNTKKRRYIIEESA